VRRTRWPPKLLHLWPLARSACEAHREWIEAQVRLRRNAVSIYQELVDKRGFTHAYVLCRRGALGTGQSWVCPFCRPGQNPGKGRLAAFPRQRRLRPELEVLSTKYSELRA